MSALEELVSIGVPVRQAAVDERLLVEAFGEQARALSELLWRSNGLYAFEGALHVLSDEGIVGTTARDYGLAAWNREELWRGEYGGMADGALFFAEDAFGVQFCLRDGAVATFEPETGAFVQITESVEGWARLVLEDHRQWTGWPSARDWQRLNGRLPMGQRLVPMTPFVMGGEFKPSNLRAMDAVKAMKRYAAIAVQIKDLPDGTKVTLRPIDD